MDISYPYSIGANGRTQTAAIDLHIRGLIEQVLFTSPGERVNRPTFGAGLRKLVFEPGGEALASTLQMAVQGAIQQWLAGLILVESVTVSAANSTINVSVRYVVRQTMERKTAEFSRAAG